MMQTYIGTKLVRMKPMTRAEYNDFRGLQAKPMCWPMTGRWWNNT